MPDYNILFIVSDTLRRDYVGAYGPSPARTPHLDRFASESVTFDHHVITTLPALLSSAGYVTVGVADTPFFIRDGWGYDRGFDDFIWIRGQGDDTRPRERADVRQSSWRMARGARAPTPHGTWWLDRRHGIDL